MTLLGLFIDLIQRPEPTQVNQSWVTLFLVLLALIVLLTFASYLYLRYFLKRSLPELGGDIELEGIQDQVVISRDPYGVPTVRAKNMEDLLFGQGFVHAQDRLWQMEVNRRIASGRLSELFGGQTVEADTFLRRLGLEEAALGDLDALSSEERAHLEAFCAGVNAGMESLKPLPVEFQLLKLKPAPWTILDSLSWIQVMSLDLCSNWEQELLRGRILEAVGPEVATLLHLFQAEAELTVPPNGLAPEVLEGLADQYEKAKAFLPNGGLPGASNAWAIAGSRTSWGHPILASDPHLAGRIPSVWYECRLICEGFDVRGAGFPGIPFVVLGSNRKVAWGITNSYADTMDLYIEKFRQGHPEQYQAGRKFRTLNWRHEHIDIKGKESKVVRVESTRHGPLLFRNDDYGLALKWKNQEPSNPIATLYKMNQASSCEEFKEALRTWQAPSSNFVFADVADNIGYLMAGHIPIRKNGTGLTPVPGWNSKYEWVGQIPFEELPQVDNPECGYVVTANNPVVGSEYRHHLTWDWMNSARAERISSQLKSHSAWTVAACSELQNDVHCAPGLRFVEACRNLEIKDKKALSVMQRLLMWDGEASKESREATLYEVTLLTLCEQILEACVGAKLGSQILGQSSNPVSIMAGHTGRYTVWCIQLLENPEKYGKLRELCPGLDGLEVVLERALLKAYDMRRKSSGTDRLWKWGELHAIQFRHILGVGPVLGRIFNAPRCEIGGDTDTVCQTAMIPQQTYGSEAWCPSYRQIVELEPLDPEHHSVLPTGQSGHPGSPNYLDQLPLWLNGETRKPAESFPHELVLRPRPSEA